MRKRLVTKIVSSVIAGSLALSLCMGGNVLQGNASTIKDNKKESNKLTDVDDVVYKVGKKEIKKMQLQGMCRGKDNIFYMFKISDKEDVTTSALYSYKIGEKIKLKNKEVALTGHANDAAYVNKSFKSNETNEIKKFNQEFNNRIYVVTSNKGGNTPEIVSIDPDSKNLSMKKYSVFIDGKHRAVSQIAYYGIKEVDGEKVPQFIIKLQSYKEKNEMQDTNNLYIGYLSTGCDNKAYDGRFVAEKQFKIDKTTIKTAIGDKYSYALGGMYYKDGTLYVTAAKKDKNRNEFVNESFIFYYNLEYDKLTKCVKNKTEDKRGKVKASKTIPLKHQALKQGNDKFEIEGIHVTDDRIYFTTNNIDQSNKSMKDALYYIKK